MFEVPTATNDPIFLLHYAFVDRIYEKWLRKFKKDANVLSTYDAPIGHNKDDVIARCFRFTLTNRCSRSLSSSAMITKMSIKKVRMISLLSIVFWLTFM